jgi:hypothetical protein
MSHPEEGMVDENEQFVSLAREAIAGALRDLWTLNMTCSVRCADSDILSASKRYILWHGICYGDKAGVKTNWRYVGKAVGLRANLRPHLHARFCRQDILNPT